MGKILSFGTLFKGQNDPLGVFTAEKSAASATAAANTAKAQADLDAHNTAAAAVNAAATPVQTEESSLSELKKKKGTSLATSLGLNI